MFTGIVENMGQVQALQKEGTNLHIELEAPFTEAIQVDQSIAHDGVCLTVTDILAGNTGEGVSYRVTAVEETLEKTQLSDWKVGKKVNLERCLKVGARLDGHFVQGHVDTIGQLKEISEREGSWWVEINYPREFAKLLVPKGSICVNGTSLTVIDAGLDSFSLTLIPYTWEHTNFHTLEEGQDVNLEFDILGKYFLRQQEIEHALSPLQG
ncbi:MAG: riboflavin synthase [Bacteroidota bacterium]